MFYKLDNDYIKFCNDDNPWIEINNDDDIENFHKHFDFEDTYIESVMYASGTRSNGKNSITSDGSHNMIITFVSFGLRFEMLFTGVRRFSLQGFNGYPNEDICCGDIEFRTDLWDKTRDDKVVVWGGLHLPHEINLKNSIVPYVIADGLKWRFAKEE